MNTKKTKIIFINLDIFGSGFNELAATEQMQKIRELCNGVRKIQDIISLTLKGGSYEI